MKDIIIVTGSMVRGGAEGVIATVANGLAQRGWKIHIISILFDRWDYKLDPTIECINISNERKNQILDAPRLVLALRRKIRQIKPDAVLSFMVAVNIVTWLATLGINVRYIPSERNDPDKGRSWLIKKLQAKAYEAADITVFQTTRAKEYFSKTIQAKGIIIPNPVKEMPEALYGMSKRIVTAGRLSEQKNHKLLIDAFKEIKKDYPMFSIEIYGEGAMKDELQAYIDDSCLSNSVHLCGKVENVPEIIRDAYMFVLSSDYEGLSNALLEAMAIGLPCISTDCAGSDDVIKNDLNGLIVPVRERAALEMAIRKLIVDPKKAIELGRKARASVKRYNINSIIDQWESILQTIKDK